MKWGKSLAGVSAKFPGRCPACSGRIEVGDRIERLAEPWLGREWTHADCHADTVEKITDAEVEDYRRKVRAKRELHKRWLASLTPEQRKARSERLAQAQKDREALEEREATEEAERERQREARRLARAEELAEEQHREALARIEIERHEVERIDRRREEQRIPDVLHDCSCEVCGRKFLHEEPLTLCSTHQVAA